MKTNATPQEKAELLVKKFGILATFVVDEILLNMYNTAYDIEDVNHPLIRFWNDVITEIEKL